MSRDKAEMARGFVRAPTRDRLPSRQPNETASVRPAAPSLTIQRSKFCLFHRSLQRVEEADNLLSAGLSFRLLFFLALEEQL